MRYDMMKVVTERPRRGHGDRNEKHGGRLSKDDIARALDTDDAGPSGLIAWSRHRNPDGGKDFTDVLGPLRGYLRKQVGRRWDDVYSEMSAVLDKGTLTGSHIWTHIKQEIEQRCYLGISGRVFYGATRRHVYGGIVTGLYVHPVTGIICDGGDRPISYHGIGERYALARRLAVYGYDLNADCFAPSVIFRWSKAGMTERPVKPKLVVKDWIIVDDVTILQRIKGCWMLHKFRKLDPEEIVYTKELNGRDIPVRRCETKERLFRHVSTRQIGRREKGLWALAKARDQPVAK